LRSSWGHAKSIVGSKPDFSVLSYAADDEANRLFIADGQGKKSYPIREFDLASGLEVGEPIPFDDLHIHKSLQLSPDNRYLFATNFYFEFISRIDLNGSREPESIRIIDAEKERGDAWRWDNGMALTPDGKFAVVPLGNDGRAVDPEGICNDQLSIVDVSQEPAKLLVEIPLEDEPQSMHVEIPSDEDAVYLATSPQPTTDVPAVYRVALTPPYVQQKFAIPEGTPKDVVVSTRLNRVFISDEGHRRIWMVDRGEFGNAQPGEFLTLEQRAPRALALHEPRHLLAVVCMASRTLHLLDSVSGRELARYERMRVGCDRPTFVDSGRRLLLNANSPEGGVAVIEVPNFEIRIAFSSDRAGGTDQIYTMRSDGSDVQPLFSQPSHAHDRHPRWSPDGRYIAFITDRNPHWNVAVVRADGTDLRIFDDTNPVLNGGPKWSPSGDRLAYVTMDQLEIHSLEVESGTVSEIPCDLQATSNEVLSICWESAETLILVAQPIRNALKREIYRLDLTTGHTTALTNEQELESSCTRPALSRDGRIATQRDLVRDGPPAGIYLLNEGMPHETMFDELTFRGPPLRFFRFFDWFPYGDQIVFTAMPEDDSFYHLYVLDISNRSYRALTFDSWNDDYPDVSPPLPDMWLREGSDAASNSATSR
jgi:WD40 repeat protein